MSNRVTIREALQRSNLHNLVYVVWGMHDGQRQVVKVGLAHRQSVGDRMRKHILSSRSTKPSRFATVLAANDSSYLSWDVDLYTVAECEELLGSSFDSLRAAEEAMCRHYKKPVGNAFF